MKSIYIGLLILLAVAALGIFAMLGGATRSTKSTEHSRRGETKATKATARKSTNGRGVFSGSDPADPRIYH